MQGDVTGNSSLEQLQPTVPYQIHHGDMPDHGDSHQHCCRPQDIQSLRGSPSQHVKTTLRAEPPEMMRFIDRLYCHIVAGIITLVPITIMLTINNRNFNNKMNKNNDN